MRDFLVDYAGMLVRWLHVVAAIAWIGSSFYFVWLDNHLRPADPPEEGVAGELWSVHGGGFYNSRKYRLAPARLPSHLHWFKWEAYWTWISGFALLALVYYSRPRELLISPDRPGLGTWGAVAISVGALAVAYPVYDALCRSPLGANGLVLAAVGTVASAAAFQGLTYVFGGRGAFLQIGSMLGTVMAANVLMVIIPGQRRSVAAMREGREPDPRDGTRGKQRSVHNNYITLPVVLLMLSNHYAVLYTDERSWLLVGAILVAGMLIRHFVNLRHTGRLVWSLPAAALAILLGMGAYLAPWDTDGADAPARAVAFEAVAPVIETRCATCHAAEPTQPGVTITAAGIELDDPGEIVAQARRIHDQAVVTEAMPLGNVTGMTDAERALIDAWFTGGAPGP